MVVVVVNIYGNIKNKMCTLKLCQISNTKMHAKHKISFPMQLCVLQLLSPEATSAIKLYFMHLCMDLCPYTKHTQGYVSSDTAFILCT